MSFRFNFSGSTSEDQEDCSIIPNEPFNTSENTSEVPCLFLNSLDSNTMLPPPEKCNVFKCPDFEIKYIVPNKSDSIGSLGVIEKVKSDLLPGKYEGGLKVWECAIDLSHFLAEKKCIYAGSSVLELGCGVGLPGLVSYLNGGLVTFQDFNTEVLEFVTLPNVLLNTLEDKEHGSSCKNLISEKCQFLSGDWHQIKTKYYSDEQNHKKYDCILTSETLYEKSNHRKLLDLMKCALKSDGIIYLASKVYYFGVGGGIHDFEKMLVEDNTFEFATVFRTDGGVERRILELKFKTSVK